MMQGQACMLGKATHPIQVLIIFDELPKMCVVSCYRDEMTEQYFFTFDEFWAFLNDCLVQIIQLLTVHVRNDCSVL